MKWRTIILWMPVFLPAVWQLPAGEISGAGPVLRLTAAELPAGPIQAWRADDGRTLNIPAGQNVQVAIQAIGGRPALVFDGNNCLEGAAVLPEGQKNYTFAAVWQGTDAEHNGVILEQSAPGNGRRAALLTVGPRYGYCGENNDAYHLAPWAAGKPAVSVLRVEDSGRVTLWHNGRRCDGAVDPALMHPGAEKFRVGMRGSAAVEGFRGVIGEIQVFDRALSDTEAQTLSEQLLQSWNIFSSPAAAFPNADFEAGALGSWTAEGDAFHIRNGNAAGLAVEPQGRYWVSSFDPSAGDRPTGKLISPPFILGKRYLNFMISGGNNPEKLQLQLVVDGTPVAVVTGSDAETFKRHSLDVQRWQGKTARIVMNDQETGSWGHLNADNFTLTDEPAVLNSFTRRLPVTGRYLVLPVNPDREFARLQLQTDGRTQAEFELQLAGGAGRCRYAGYDVSAWKGRDLVIAGDALTPEQAAAVNELRISDTIPGGETDYQLPYRNQFHFSVRRGWNNDPNGLVRNGNRWNLYYQYNPVFHGFNGQNWGYAHSEDLVHWTEEGIVLPVRSLKDQAYSGGGFLDTNNSLGMNRDGVIAQVAAFTSTGRGESLAYSLDGGKSFTEIDGNPVLRQPGRDPRVFFHHPSNRWIMIVYNETPGVRPEALPDQRDRANSNYSIFSSRDLRHWELESRFTSPLRIATYECPDLYELPVEGKPGETRWVVSGVFNYYHIGRFDGKVFTPETGPLQVETGDVRASQSFSDNPDGRRIQIGWNNYQYGDPLVPFSQGFTLPHEITLRETPDGLRLFSNPARELETLRQGRSVRLENPDLAATDRALRAFAGELVEVIIRWEAGDGARLQLTVNGMEYTLDGHHALRLYDDRALTEAFFDDGAEVQIHDKPDALLGSKLCGLKASGDVRIRTLEIYQLKSIWTEAN